MEHVACSNCEWDGEAVGTDDQCPHCHQRGTLVPYAAVAWAIAGNTVTQGAR